MNCWVTVVACAGFSWVSPWTIEIFVWLARLSLTRASCAKCSCSWPRNATGPVSGPSMPIVATHDLVVVPPELLLPPLLQPATTSAPSAAVAMTTFRLIDMPLHLLECFTAVGVRWYQARLARMDTSPVPGNSAGR